MLLLTKVFSFYKQGKAMEATKPNTFVGLLLLWSYLLVGCNGRVNIILDTDMVDMHKKNQRMLNQYQHNSHRILMLMMSELCALLTDWLN